MNRRNLLLIAFLLVLVALANWLGQEGARQVDKRLTRKAAVPQDYYLKKFTITAMDDAGKPQHELTADSLNYFAEQGQTELQQPRLVIYEKHKQAWYVEAQSGTLMQQNNEISLQGKVRLQRKGGATPLMLTTESLNIYPQQGRADTSRAVTLVQGNSRIKGVGMRFEQQGPHLVLLSRVRGYYDVSHN